MPNPKRQLERWAAALEPFVSEPVRLKTAPPLDTESLRRWEARLGREIPAPLCQFVQSVGSRIEFWWFLKDDVVPLDVPNKPYAGYFEFNLETLSNINSQSEMEFLHPDTPVEERERWQRAFRFAPVPNGDALGFDLTAAAETPPIIYLDHEQPGKCIRLANSFEDFISAWFGLGCVGPECWNLCHFLTEQGEPLPAFVYGTPSTRLDIDCPNARKYKSHFGL